MKAVGNFLFIVDQETEIDTPEVVPDIVIVAILNRYQVADTDCIIEGEKETTFQAIAGYQVGAIVNTSYIRVGFLAEIQISFCFQIIGLGYFFRRQVKRDGRSTPINQLPFAPFVLYTKLAFNCA